jgi:N-acetylglucosaminyldiphosphoundecaprenol N-acetyl-beta-D-mannosaminyltransferase
LRVLGVDIANATSQQALDLIEQLALSAPDSNNAIYIVNAHTLNLACESPPYRQILNGARIVFADGTGVRWAARLRGVRMQANLVGTDLIPALFHSTAGKGYRYFMLGASAHTIQRAASHCERMYPGWTLAGFHHGYVQNPAAAARVIKAINAARPHVLLVGMGNPLQEQWIHRHRASLRVPVSIGVGGLFDHWGGNLKRAPAWVRRHGCEWLQLLLQQPHKWQRYLIGNPKFLLRILSHLPHERNAAAGR